MWGGDLLKGLKQRGFHDLYGIDPSKKSIESLRGEGIEGSVGNIFDEVPEDLRGKFDIVCCTAVMEHIYDVNGAVKRVMQYMNPQNGKLFLDVPAVEGFEKYAAKLPNYFNHEHINYFSLKTLDNLLATVGLTRINNDVDSFYACSIKNHMPELVLQGIYRYSKEDRGLAKDTQSIEAVKRYFAMIEKENNQEVQSVKELVFREKKVIIWGTGAFSMWLLRQIPEIEKNLVCFIDNNVEKQGTVLCGKRVYGADYLTEEKEDAVIVICSMQNSREIADQIDKMNIGREYLILE